MSRNQDEIRDTANLKLGRLLYKARMNSGQSLNQIATSLGLSEDILRSIEERPAETPCSNLYNLLAHYGPKRVLEAQLILWKI